MAIQICYNHYPNLSPHHFYFYYKQKPYKICIIYRLSKAGTEENGNKKKKQSKVDQEPDKRDEDGMDTNPKLFIYKQNFYGNRYKLNTKTHIQTDVFLYLLRDRDRERDGDGDRDDRLRL